MKHDDASYRYMLEPTEDAPDGVVAISRLTFIRQVGSQKWKEFAKYLGYKWGVKPSIYEDVAVTYGRGRWLGEPCVFATKAGKNYIFVTKES